MTDKPDVLYAWNGDTAIAYQVFGDGAADLVYLPPYASNLEWNWEHPTHARYLRRLASFSRLIIIERRGWGCSDGSDPGVFPSLETHAQDLTIVLDAVGVERAVLFGAHESCFTCMLAAATYPSRVASLILYGATASYVRSESHPWQPTREEWEPRIQGFRDWGTRQRAARYIETRAPSLRNDGFSLDWFTTLQRLTIGPGGAITEMRDDAETDLSYVLPSIRVPTMVLHRTEDPAEDVRSGRYVADHIPQARLVELPGNDSLPWVGDADAVLVEVEAFLTGVRPQPLMDRVLATIMFTDIVGSTQRASELGDARWKELLADHDRRARAEVERVGGRVVAFTGDGLVARFDGPARGIHCARAIARSVRELGLEIRAGCHTGEVELVGDDVRGIAVHIGARVAALAGPGEVLVSSTVKDLVAGSGLAFEDAGEHELKGVPDRWHLYAVTT